MGRTRIAIATLSVLAGCGTAPAREEASAPNAVAPTSAPAIVENYDRCRDRARGDVPALQTCADAEIARIAGTLPSGDTAAARDFAATLPLLGDDALDRGVFGKGAAAGAAAAAAGVRLARARAALLTGGEAPSPAGDADTQGTEARASWARSRASTCAAYRIADCAARYDALLATYAPAEDHRPMPAAPLSGLPLPDCAEVRASALVGGALGDAFYRRYPKPLADPGVVETVTLAPAALDNVVDYLACVATLTDGDPVVADNAAALFASHRHGRAAFARLAVLADRPGAAGAGRFLAQMKAVTAAE